MSKPNFDSTVTDTVIAQGVEVKGNLECESDVWIDGLITGSVRSNASVTLGVNGRVLGNITAANLAVAGSIEGNLRIEERLLLAPSARVQGDIKTAVLNVEDGAVISGQLSMPAGQTNPPAEPSATTTDSN